MANVNKVLVRVYRGSQAGATRTFQADATILGTQGYIPTSQTWAPGSYGCGSFLFALLLCLVIIGVIIFVYMLLVKPPGTLTVTYELRESSPVANAGSGPNAGEKTCPRCAEHVKAAAKVCRFCSYSFES
jgi:hypothetical protein